MEQNIRGAAYRPLPIDVDHLTGPTVVRLMHAHGRTIRSVSGAMGVTQQRVREVRDRGVRGVGYVWDWAQGITGDARLSWADIARLYVGSGCRAMPKAAARQRFELERTPT